MPQMSEKGWMDDIPPSRIASHEELIAQYGKKEIENRSFFFKIMSTRQSRDLTVLNCHAYWQFFFRMKDGNWKVINMGFYAFRFHEGILDKLWLICHTLRRVMSLIDQNGYYTHRQRGGCPIFPSKEDEEKILEKIYQCIVEEGVFQFAGNNCARPVQTKTEKVIKNLPNFFKVPITQVKLGVSPLDRFLAWANRQSDRIKKFAINVLHTLFLSFRTQTIKKKKGNVSYSVKKYFSTTHEIYNPAFLPHQIDEARKKGKDFHRGELYWSHTDEKIYQRKMPTY